MAEKVLPHKPEGLVPQEQVERIFANFSVPFFRGGHSIVRPTFYTPGSGRFQSPKDKRYNAETSFSSEQQSFTDTATSYMNLLAMGIVYGAPNSSPAEPLAEKIINAFLKQNEPRHFEQAQITALEEIMMDYYDRYRNLTPAMHTVLITNGIAGIGISLDRSERSLQAAQDGTLSIGEFNTQSRTKADLDSFVGLHEERGTPYGVPCTGHELAITIHRQSIVAAQELARNSVTQSYRYDPNRYPFALRQLQARADSLRSQTAISF